MKQIPDNQEQMIVRPHHICCIPFFIQPFTERGEPFNRMEASLKRLMSEPGDLRIMVREGADELCLCCTHCKEGVCVSPRGSEEQVKKWDSILLSEINVGFNTEMTASAWQKRIADKIPYKICPKCQWRTICKVGLSL
jgi:hypothetical protein